MLGIRFIIVISIFIILLTLIYASTFFKKNSRLDIFVDRLPIASHFFVGLGILVTFLLFVFIWVRASFPRYRYDQLMRLGWKVFLPLSFAFVLWIAGVLIATN